MCRFVATLKLQGKIDLNFVDSVFTFSLKWDSHSPCQGYLCDKSQSTYQWMDGHKFDSLPIDPTLAWKWLYQAYN